ncbi:MAG TPA: ribose-phosphate diphosphokinase [Burkholderiales bacterium]|jgi:ribose-phosphate pyrophosphokinase
MSRPPPLIFALGATRAFGLRVAERLGTTLAAHEEREFEDGEHKARPLENVRGRDAYVIHSLYSEPTASVNDKLMRLLLFVGALRDASAAHVAAVVPYLGYARKDMKTQPRDPVTTRYIAALFEAVGTDRVVTLDVHNLAAFQNAFRCHTDHLDTSALFARHFSARIDASVPIAVVSPDAGGVKRAERLRRQLARLRSDEPTSAFLEKSRAKGVMTPGKLVGDVAGRTAIIVDDLISTGGTLAHAARACRAAGAVAVHAAAAHGLFTGDAERTLADSDIGQVTITDTIPPFRLTPERVRGRLAIVPVTELFAHAVQRIHAGDSLIELLDIP